jgi:hypothetical protein
MAVAGAAGREEIRRRLREDYEFAVDTAGAARIVTKEGLTVTMRLKRPQRRLVRGLMAQRDAGQPQRAQALKARQIGISTIVQVMGILRTTQTQNHLAITVAQDRTTVAALFGIGRHAWSQLPDQIKPPAAYEGGTLERKFLQFGEPSIALRRAGVLGLNSSYETATARRAASGRGRTIHSLHLSEPAWWDDYGMMLGIVQGVPDLPNTLVVKESTANGNNEFKDEWDDAVAGVSGYLPFFSPWYEEDEYRRAFTAGLDADEFHARLGSGRSKREQEAAEEEPLLLARILADLEEWARLDDEPFDPAAARLRALEHLYWRRWAIGAKCQGDLQKLHQEYPSTADEAFLSSGRKVFRAEYMARALAEAARQDPDVPTVHNPGPAMGLLRGREFRVVRSRRHVTIEVPKEAVWVPRSKRQDGEVARWRVWHLPQQEALDEYAGEAVMPGQQILGSQIWTPPGQYLVNVDSASGKEDDAGTVHANHAITVIDHRTLRLVAEFESQQDPDDLALETLLAALFFNRAWVTVESTGGWGLPVLRRLALDYHYPRLFHRETVRKRIEDRSEDLGFSTDHVTKPLLEARAIELVRDHPEIVTSRVLASQMLTYVRDSKGRTGPEPGKLADVLMSWMIGQFIATIRPIRTDRPGGQPPPRIPRKPRRRR